MKKIIASFVFFLIFISAEIFADDVYLKNGSVWRNVQISDTTIGKIKILKDSSFILIDTSEVLKIDYREFVSWEKSKHEIFSKELQEDYLKKLMEKEIDRRRERTTANIDSDRDGLSKSYSWQRSLYFAGGLGSPQGLRFELGYSSVVTFAFSFGIYDSWSRDPAEGTIAVIASLRLPIQELPFTPYILGGFGKTLSIFGSPDKYSLVHLGILYELSSGIHLRPEIGIIYTTKHISGGPSLFGGYTPAVDEKTSKFGFNLILEIDFANL